MNSREVMLINPPPLMKLALQLALLGIILVIFNAIILNDPMALRSDTSPIFSLPLPSGAEWLPGTSDLLIIGGVVLLYLELFKATRTSVGAIVEHILSLVVFLIFLIEFIVFAPADTGVSYRVREKLNFFGKIGDPVFAFRDLAY